MGKHGGRQKPAGEEKGWGEGGRRGPGMASPALHSQVSRAKLKRTPPLAPRGRSAWPRRQPPLPLSSTSSLSSLRPSRVWDSRALTPNRDWATKAPTGRLRGSRPGPEEGQAPKDSRSSQPLPTSSLPSLGPGSWTFGKNHWGLQVGGGTAKRSSYCPPLLSARSPGISARLSLEVHVGRTQRGV